CAGFVARADPPRLVLQQPAVRWHRPALGCHRGLRRGDGGHGRRRLAPPPPRASGGQPTAAETADTRRPDLNLIPARARAVEHRLLTDWTGRRPEGGPSIRHLTVCRLRRYLVPFVSGPRLPLCAETFARRTFVPPQEGLAQRDLSHSRSREV